MEQSSKVRKIKIKILKSKIVYWKQGQELTDSGEKTVIKDMLGIYSLFDGSDLYAVTSLATTLK